MKYECEACGFVGDKEYKIEEDGDVLKVCQICYDGYARRNGLAVSPTQQPEKTDEQIAMEAYEAFSKLKKKSRTRSKDGSLLEQSGLEEGVDKSLMVDPQVKQSILERIGLEDFDIGDTRSETALSKLLGVSDPSMRDPENLQEEPRQTQNTTFTDTDFVQSEQDMTLEHSVSTPLVETHPMEGALSDTVCETREPVVLHPVHNTRTQPHQEQVLGTQEERADMQASISPEPVIELPMLVQMLQAQGDKIKQLQIEFDKQKEEANARQREQASQIPVSAPLQTMQKEHANAQKQESERAETPSGIAGEDKIIKWEHKRIQLAKFVAKFFHWIVWVSVAVGLSVFVGVYSGVVLGLSGLGIFKMILGCVGAGGFSFLFSWLGKRTLGRVSQGILWHIGRRQRFLQQSVGDKACDGYPEIKSLSNFLYLLALFLPFALLASALGVSAWLMIALKNPWYFVVALLSCPLGFFVAMHALLFGAEVLDKKARDMNNALLAECLIQLKK
ncbi:MAG: hypothetical protein FWD76_04340 [Firmicutes bacterium]|nr:hypothetical protein [Bacillota bacterium]